MSHSGLLRETITWTVIRHHFIKRALPRSAWLKKGGTHVWGEAAMPPNVLASDADIKELVDWILTLKK
jgi:hypothetical protein